VNLGRITSPSNVVGNSIEPIRSGKRRLPGFRLLAGAI